MSEKMRLGVLFGGRSGEHEVSLMSARSIMQALNKERYAIVPIGISKDGRWFTGEDALQSLEKGELREIDPVVLLGQPDGGALYHFEEAGVMRVLAQLDVVFPVLHGTFGEDGTVQGLCELADLPYVGAGVLASSVAMDKGLFKDVMRAHHIPVVDWVVVTSREIEADLDDVLRRAEALGDYPLFTKPANLGSSVGITRCERRADLAEGLLAAARYDRRIVIERGLEAREIEVSVLGNENPEASIAGEVVPGDRFYSYKAKYLDDSSQLIIPAHLDAETMEEVRRLAVESYRAVDGAGMARVDFLLEKTTGKLYLNEMNTIPGFTKISMYPKLWEASGLPYPDLLDRLIDLAMERFAQKQGLLRSYEGEG